MTKRIFRSICVVSLTAMLVTVGIIIGILYSQIVSTVKNQLKIETSLAAKGISENGIDFFTDLETEDFRLTWISSDGSVLYDSRSSESEMENHLEREEVRQAIENGYGEASRYSATLTEKLYYCAQKLPDGTIVRLSVSYASILTILVNILYPFVYIAIAVIVICIIVAYRLSKKIVKPLNELNLNDPMKNRHYQEITPLLERLEGQQLQLRRQAEELKRRQDEFNTITFSMKEGLVLINENGIILAINQAAKQLLCEEKNCVGKDIQSLNSSFEISELLIRANKKEQKEKFINIDGRTYQFNATPIYSEEKTIGYVLLMFDVTEKEQAESLRREFTANVSHELKTPLHSISGCAELLYNDLVKEDDKKQFIGQIYSESKRMIHLIEDIIGLSSLDEGGGDMRSEQVDLYLLVKESVYSLQNEANNAKVSLTTEGIPLKIMGIPRLIGVIVFNLVDNAIKYNKENGSVYVTVQEKDDYAVLSVADTGIGIPNEHQTRIFERFYRVDKSRSKQVGGTGLGLSIVKHAARILGAKTELHSVVDEGTTIVVRFPKN